MAACGLMSSEYASAIHAAAIVTAGLRSSDRSSKYTLNNAKPAEMESTCPQAAEMKTIAGLNRKSAATPSAQRSLAKRRTMAYNSAPSAKSIRTAGNLTRYLSSSRLPCGASNA